MKTEWQLTTAERAVLLVALHDAITYRTVQPQSQSDGDMVAAYRRIMDKL